MKEQVDITHQKEVELKACIQPWLEEVFMITATNEGKLTQLQDAYTLVQEGDSNTTSESCAQVIQQKIEECVADINTVQMLLDGL